LSDPVLRVKFLRAMRLNMKKWINRFKSQNKGAFERFGKSIVEHAKRLELKSLVMEAKESKQVKEVKEEQVLDLCYLMSYSHA